MLSGFSSLIPPKELATFNSQELELLLSGRPHIDPAFIRQRTVYLGYSSSSAQVEWLWEVVGGFSHEERSLFLKFCTGCACLPIEEVEVWQFRVQKGSAGEENFQGHSE